MPRHASGSTHGAPASVLFITLKPASAHASNECMLAVAVQVPVGLGGINMMLCDIQCSKTTSYRIYDTSIYDSHIRYLIHTIYMNQMPVCTYLSLSWPERHFVPMHAVGHTVVSRQNTQVLVFSWLCGASARRRCWTCRTDLACTDPQRLCHGRCIIGILNTVGGHRG